jgi:hypothetical protein
MVIQFGLESKQKSRKPRGLSAFFFTSLLLGSGVLQLLFFATGGFDLFGFDQTVVFFLRGDDEFFVLPHTGSGRDQVSITNLSYLNLMVLL